MAPLGFSDSVNMSAAVGTWLGSLFTGIGLIAVISQLRTYLSTTSARRERFISRAAGAWSDCFLNKQVLHGEGEIKEVAPALAGWIQKRYLEADTIRLTQSDTCLAGTSSWSKFLAQCFVSPHQLVHDGGPSAAVYPTGAVISRKPIQADVRIEDGKFMYGMSSAEFAAMMVLSGFSTMDFSGTTISSPIKYLGTMHLASHGVFSQIAHFDAHGNPKVMKVESPRLVHKVPVQGAIHLALGILKLTRKRHRREWIIIPQQCPASEAWTTLPNAAQLRSARYNLEALVMVSGGSVIPYSSLAVEDHETEKDLMMQIVGQSGPSKFHEALMAAYAVDALVPWGLLPVAPKSFSNAFEQLLRPCIAPRGETIGTLIQTIQNMWSANLRARHEGWQDVNEQTSSLDRIGDLRTEYFSGSSNYCAYYYDAMLMAFDTVHLSIEDVRQTLAALVAWLMLYPDDAPYPAAMEIRHGSHRQTFFDSMMSHLNSNSQSSTRTHGDISWAVKIYATYMWAWLHDGQDQDDNLVGRFHRRIFME